jgi:uncharacterized protein (DUF1919 family)
MLVMFIRICRCCARFTHNLLLPTDVSVISDDCWGGEFYRSRRLPYLTPTAGLFIEPHQYLAFLRHLRAPDAFALTFVASSHGFPVAVTPYATINFMHYSTPQEAEAAFRRRAERIVWQKLFYKIDFGKPGYGVADVETWNHMRLPNSVALVPASSPLAQRDIWHRCVLPHWEINGARMYHVSRRFFDLSFWARTGAVRMSLMNTLLSRAVSSPGVPVSLKEALLE